MAIAMRLRNQLQSVYKLDPLRNEVSRRAVRDRPRRAGDSEDAKVGQRPVKRLRLRDIVVSAALMERRERSRSAAIGAPPPCEHACSPGVHPCCFALAAEQRQANPANSLLCRSFPPSLCRSPSMFSEELTRLGSDARGEAGRVLRLALLFLPDAAP